MTRFGVEDDDPDDDLKDDDDFDEDDDKDEEDDEDEEDDDEEEETWQVLGNLAGSPLMGSLDFAY